MNKIIFFGNGRLADEALAVLTACPEIEIIFHARTREDLARVAELKKQTPDAYGILASFGVLIKSDLLELFEPTGILNLHPSLLPKYRGASPIESAILAGETEFGYSIMKLAKAMDAGPVYHQEVLCDLPLDKTKIYAALATAGAEWLCAHLENLPEPIAQDESQATFCGKLDKSMSQLEPTKHSATEIWRQIIAYQDFPKPKYKFFGKNCIILAAHVVNLAEISCEPASIQGSFAPLALKCADRNFVVIDRLQPEGKKPMDVKSFMNGYGR